jgi:putative protease
MELLAPAGSPEKLRFAYRFGADAAYIGLPSFSLRARADNFPPEAAPDLEPLKAGEKRLYLAVNAFLHQADTVRLEKALDGIAAFPLDAFIVSDLGAAAVLRRRFPAVPLHLSTQANCLNAEAAKVYRDLGFSRIVLGREVTLSEIGAIKAAVPELELEAFVHGAMCLAYSGRCYLSAALTGRSANEGDCTHSCRWRYRVLEEAERPGEYLPVEEGAEFTTLLSSKDLCMFDHLRELRDAGVDAAKIEGRMKSLYYTAVVTRAYRAAIDALDDPVADMAPYREELRKTSRREFSTGFYFGRRDADETTSRSYVRSYRFVGTIGEKVGRSSGRLNDAFREAGRSSPPEELYRLHLRNKLAEGEEIEYIGPRVLYRRDRGFRLYDTEGRRLSEAGHGTECFIEPSEEIAEDFIIRKIDPSET